MRFSRLLSFVLFASAALQLSGGDVNRRRDVIFYHYDMVPVLWPKHLPYSGDAIINGFSRPRRKMDGLPAKAMAADVKPDTIVYVPMPNFANLSAMVPSNEPQLNNPGGSTWMGKLKNALPEIKKLGKSKDPVSVMCAWTHANKKEFFVGLCVNESLFQSGYLKTKPPPPYLVDNYMFNPFKAKHLDWLMGSHKEMPPLKGFQKSEPPYAPWTLVDYEQAEVRAKFVAIAQDIIKGYDIDGIMIDFCRQPRLFRSVAWGGVATAGQTASITEMMGHISAAAKEKGCLVAVRVPDSIPACKDAGMDVVAWFTQKFADLLFVGGAVELNHWSVAADMASKCGVPFYASIDPSRIHNLTDEGHREDDQRMPRQCQEVYRARVLEAREFGAKGIMYTSGRQEWFDSSYEDYTDPRLFQPSTDKIRLENKRYFVNYRTKTGGTFLKDIAKYASVQGKALMTMSPDEIKGNAKYEIYVCDDFATLKKEGITPKCFLTTVIEIPSGWKVDVNLNGRALKAVKKRAGSQVYEIPPGEIVHGKNEVALSVKGSNKRGLVPRIGNIGIDVLFKGDLETLMKPGNDGGEIDLSEDEDEDDDEASAAKKPAKKPAAKKKKKGGAK